MPKCKFSCFTAALKTFVQGDLKAFQNHVFLFTTNKITSEVNSKVVFVLVYLKSDLPTPDRGKSADS